MPTASAHSLSHHSPPPTAERSALSAKTLLMIFLALPLVALFITVDYLFNDFGWSRQLPSDPNATGLLNTVFMLPHVMASFFTFADKEYLTAYGPRLGISAALILSGSLVLPLWLGWGSFFLILVLYTVNHQVSQQAGIAALVAKNKAPTHTAWKWLYMMLLMVLVFAAALENNPDYSVFFTAPIKNYGVALLAFFIVIFVVLTTLTAIKSKTKIGVAYIAASAGLLLFNFFLWALGFDFFVLLLTRIVHDITALAFYVAHNENRARENPKSMMLFLKKKIPLPEYILTPAVALMAALALTFYMPQPYLLHISLFLAFFHYYWEGVMWKHGSPHRAYLKI